MNIVTSKISFEVKFVNNNRMAWYKFHRDKVLLAQLWIGKLYIGFCTNYS